MAFALTHSEFGSYYPTRYMDWLFNVRDFDSYSNFAVSAARARARLPFGFRYPDAARPTQVSRSLRVAGAAFRLPVPPRACCCSWPFRGRGAGALAQPSRTGVKRKRRSLGLARAPSETVTQSRAPETAGERSRSDGLAVRGVPLHSCPVPQTTN